MNAAQEAWWILRSLLALGIVLGLAWLSLRYGLPRLMQRRGRTLTAPLHVEAFYPLDRQHRLYVIRWEDLHLLIATSPSGVRLLYVRGAPAAASDTAFGDLLKRMETPGHPVGEEEA